MLSQLMRTLSRRPKISKAPRRTSRSTNTTLHCESLEDRRMLSASNTEVTITEEVDTGLYMERTISLSAPNLTISPIQTSQAMTAAASSSPSGMKFNFYGGTELFSLINSTNPSEVQLGQNVVNGFIEAANAWSSLLSDDVTLNISINLPTLSVNTLGSTSSERIVSSYSDVLSKLNSDVTSSTDTTMMANAQPGPSLWLKTNERDGTLINITNSSDYYANSLSITRANAKALDLISANSSYKDAEINFNRLVPFDFDSSNGITSGSLDFVAIATHEIGHVLGFESGVDTVDVYSEDGPGASDDLNGADPGLGDLSNYAVFTPLDLTRYSNVALGYHNQPTSGGLLDLQYSQYFGNRPFFSIDANNSLATYSEGRYNSNDEQQASHWEDGQGIGLMDPTLASGEHVSISAMDLLAMDAIGWDLTAPQVTAVEISGSSSTHSPYTFDNTNVGSGEQLRTVPVGGADTISITFNRDVTVSKNDLSIVALQFTGTASVASSTFSYNSTTNTATWVFASSFTADQYLIQLDDNIVDSSGVALDGEWTNPAALSTVNGGLSTFPSGDGAAGGNFEFVFTILPGDFNRDNLINFQDTAVFSDNFEQHPSGGALFSQGDITGEGYVNFQDAGAFSFNFNRDLAILEIAADFDNDYAIDPDDLGILLAKFGTSVAAGEDGDIDSDADVDADDLGLLLIRFGLELDVLS